MAKIDYIKDIKSVEELSIKINEMIDFINIHELQLRTLKNKDLVYR